jgi:hypothetical protein
LSVVADPIYEIVDETVTTPVFHATQLMELIVMAAQSTSDPATSGSQFLGLLKNLDAGARIPSADVVNAAPLDWYDAAQVSQWPTWSTTASTGSADPAPRPPDRIWSWRSLSVAPRIELTATTDTASSAVGTPSAALDRTAAPVESFAVRPVIASAVSRALPVEATATARSTPLSGTMSAARESLRISPDWLALRAAASPVAVGPVQTPTLTLSLSYQVVQLGRAAWWSDALVADRNWCFPGERAGAVLPGGLAADSVVGLPVALILTDNVRVTGDWTDVDLQSVAQSTNFGPWALKGPIDSNGVLAMEGIQLIAVTYQRLPAIPPADDPTLPPLATQTTADSPAPTTSGDAPPPAPTTP